MDPKIMDGLGQISSTFGSGNVMADLVFAALGVSVVSLIFGLVVYRRSLKPMAIPGLDRISGIGGRVEKLEMTLNELRTDMMRSAELSRGDLGFLKVEIEYLRRLLEQLTHKGPAGGGSTPSESSGGPSSGGDDRGHHAIAHEAFAAPPPVSVESVLPSAPEIAAPAESPEQKGLFARLAKTRQGLISKIQGLFGRRGSIDAASLDELEAILIGSDIGVATTQRLMGDLQAEVESGGLLSEEKLFDRLRALIYEIVSKDAPSDPRIHPAPRADGPLVVVVVGVNGSGKTTSVAKLAHQWKEKGATVMMAAADTFRAAAVEQLKEWGSRLDIPVIAGAENAKPATVVFDAMEKAKAANVDVLIIDTAGRLHTKSNLMQELEGVKNAITRHQASAPHEVLLVVDGSSGQNALSQAREFNSAVKLTGLIVTKLDGTPKGGIVVAIKSELGIPVRYIGVGEKKEDLRAFLPHEFASAICERERPGQDAPIFRADDSVLH